MSNQGYPMSKELKEHLGHPVKEVTAGTLLGIIVAIMIESRLNHAVHAFLEYSRRCLYIRKYRTKLV